MGKEYNVAMTLTEIRQDPKFLVRPILHIMTSSFSLLNYFYAAQCKHPPIVVEYHTIPTRFHSRLLVSSLINDISAELLVTIQFQPDTAVLEGTHDNIQEAVSRIGSVCVNVPNRPQWPFHLPRV
jgi:hypothetical protein